MTSSGPDVDEICCVVVVMTFSVELVASSSFLSDEKVVGFSVEGLVEVENVLDGGVI